VEDYSGKTEMVLFGDDYVKYNSYLETGQAILICGSFKKRPYRDEYEFKVSSIILAENAKKQLTKQVQFEVDVRNLEKEMVDFFEKNMKQNPGKATLKFLVSEPKEKLSANLVTMDKGIEMNRDLIEFLESKPEIDVQVMV
jgi:DNA polymerase-3 subunit alpha